MSFDQSWEKAHSTRVWGKYPNEYFVRFMMGNYKNVPDRSAVKVLEIGCGIGANLWFVAREGFSACGIDGSESAIKNAKEFFAKENLEAEFITMRAEDFDAKFADGSLDVISDICCLYTIPYEESSKTVDVILKKLKPGGKFFAMNFGVGTWGEGLGKKVSENSYTDVTEGPFKDLGYSHLFTREELENWGRKFSKYNIEKSSYTVGSGAHNVNHFIFTAEK